MKRRTAGWIAAGAGAICIVSALLHMTGFLELWVAAAAIVCLFPVAALALFFWWMAGVGGGDIPFIGY